MWDKKGKLAKIFNVTKKKRLLEIKEIGAEEWIKRQWE